VDKAVILIAHGSRVASTALEMDQIITKMRQSGLSCYPAYMEIQQPSLMDTVESLVSQGVSEVAILPLFFFIGRHLRDDIPEQLKQCRERWPEVSFEQLTHIGAQESFLEALKASGAVL